jgi:dCMP deaminase
MLWFTLALPATRGSANWWGFSLRQTWDEWFVGLASYIATRSKDPSTKVGAVIARRDNTIAACGYNGFPRYVEDHPGLLGNRDEKLKRVIHAEMNAILTAKEPLHGCTLYSTLFTCERCAVHVIQSGITRVVAPAKAPEHLAASERWKEAHALAEQLYSEANVEVTLL